MKIHQTLLPLIALSVSAPTYAIERGDSLKSEMLEEVVVTGSNSSVSRNLIPYTVSTVTSERLEATGRTQVLTAISGMVPSLFVSQRNIFGFGISNGGAGGIKIRGVGGSPTNAVLMMVDGQPQFAGIYSHHVADFYETDYVDRVEVLRGPGSVLYGSNAMGGVINVVTKNVHDDGAHFSLQSEYGSYNTWLSTLNGTARYGKFSALVSLSYDRTDGLQKTSISIRRAHTPKWLMTFQSIGQRNWIIPYPTSKAMIRSIPSSRIRNQPTYTIRTYCGEKHRCQ